MISQATLDTTALRSHDDRIALADRSGQELSYQRLADLVDRAVARLGSGRRLIVLEIGSDVSSVVHYLAALSAGHAVILTEPGRADAVAGPFEPDTSVHGSSGVIVHHREEPAHLLHPDLALLLSTSGSTGSAKLVRLSARNLSSNAAAIAESLRIRPTDRALTTLPLHYTYGLSVLHSHLAVGSAVVLTDASVADPGFVDLLRSARITTMPGVPHTYELLHRTPFVDADLPDLRLLTQAGGRLAPTLVGRYVDLGQQRGFDFVVMYGQTEATARMSYLPADLARDNPDSVGIAIPGGSFRLQSVPEAAPGSGELIYSGPNVMMGYATCPAHLACGAEVGELRTGDLARIDAAGLIRIVGRRARFAKVFGLRVDLARVEQVLADRGYQVAVADLGDALGVALATDAIPEPMLAEQVRLAAAQAATLPLPAVRIRLVPCLPRSSHGKVDGAAVRDLFASGDAGLPGMPDAGQEPREQSGSSVRGVFAAVLGLVPERIAGEDTFTSLGGDSMSYIVTSTRLETLLGGLPADWPSLSVAELSEQAEAAVDEPTSVAREAKSREVTDEPNRTSWFRLCRVETNVLLRAIAIVLIVGGHVGVMDIRGGAHLLLVIAGLNYARFQLSSPSRERRWRHGIASWRRVLVPSVVWLALVVTIGTEYGWAVLFGTNLFGPDAVSPEWRYWYVESFLAVFGIVVALMAVPMAHRAEQRDPFGWAMALVVVGLAARFVFAADSGPATIYTPAVVAWLFFVGWALAVATTPGQRRLALAALGLGLIDYFDDHWRAAVVVVGVLALVFVAGVRLPRFLVPAVASLASASLFIYLTHWQVYPPLAAWPWVSLLVALIVGVVTERAWRILTAGAAVWWARGATPRTDPDPGSDTVLVQPRRPAGVAR